MKKSTDVEKDWVQSSIMTCVKGKDKFWRKTN